jgi:hypothetical protein
MKVWAGMLNVQRENHVKITARMIIENNIRHYRNLLRLGTDPAMRENLARVIADEEAKLASLLEEERKDEAP